MKTKNIFRTLLVAAALLLGGNQAKAEEEVVWEGHTYWNDVAINGSLFADISGGTTIRVYSNDSGDIYFAVNWNAMFYSEGQDWVRTWGADFSQYHKSGYYEFLVSEEQATTIKQGTLNLKLNGDIYKVTYENVASTGPFTITIASGITNGSISASKSEATFGEEIVLSNTPAEGYKLKEYIVTKATGATVSVSGNSFQMPAGSVTVSAAFIDKRILYDGDAKNNFTISSTEIIATGIKIGDKVRLYTTSNNGNIYNLGGEYHSSWSANTLGGNDAAPYYHADGGYYEFEVTNTWYSDLTTNGLNLITDGGNPATKIIVIDGNGSTPVTPDPVVTKYTFNYIVDGTTVQSFELEAGAAIPSPNNTPSKDGYNFTGWDGMPTNNVMPEGNVNVYAQFEEIPREYVDAPIVSSTGWATFCSDKVLDFSGVSGLTAYIAKQVSSTAVTLEEVTGIVPANTGLILKGTAGTTYQVLVANGSGYISGNLLVGVMDNQTLNNASYYVLTDESGIAKFADTKNQAATVTAGHAFLNVGSAGSRARFLQIIDNPRTGLDSIEAAESGEEVIFDLQGRRVENPSHGIFIINGKKVVIK